MDLYRQAFYVFFLLPDRTEGKKFSKDLEAANTRMAEFCAQLDKDVKMKPTLIESLEKSEIFYEAQYKEVKIVVNVCLKFIIGTLSFCHNSVHSICMSSVTHCKS